MLSRPFLTNKFFKKIHIYVYSISIIFGSLIIILFHMIFKWMVYIIYWSFIIVLAIFLFGFTSNIVTIVSRLYEGKDIQHESTYHVFCSVYEEWSGDKFSMHQVNDSIRHWVLKMVEGIHHIVNLIFEPLIKRK